MRHDGGMPFPPRSWLVAAVAAVLVGGASAQQVVRRPTFARVLGPDGAPLAGATVTFAGGRPELDGSVGPRDVQVVMADEKGRATAKLLPGLCYVAWAVGPADPQGRSVLTAVQGCFAASALVEIRGSDRPAELEQFAPEKARELQNRLVRRGPRRVTVTGAAAWTDSGPLRFVATMPYPGVDQDLTPDAAGVLEVPRGPFTTIEVRTADGAPLWSAPIEERFAIPPPAEIPVRTLDEREAPVAGARVDLRVDRLAGWRLDGVSSGSTTRLRPLGRTGPDGRLRVRVPAAGDPLRSPSSTTLLLFASAPDRASVAGGVFQGSVYVDDHKVKQWDGPDLVFHLGAAAPLRGNLGPAPAGSSVQMTGVAKLFTSASGYTHDPRTFVVPIAADGSFEFREVPAELHSCRLSVVLPEGAANLPLLLPGLPSRQLPDGLTATLPGGKSAAPEVAVVHVAVTEPDGGPARGIVGFLVPGDSAGQLVRDSMARVPLDAAGGADLRLLPGRWVLTFVTPSAYGTLRLDAAAGEREVAVALKPYEVLRLRLLDGGGAPIAGARVQVRGTSTQGRGDPLESLLQSLAQRMRATWPDQATDAEGRLAIRFLSAPGLTYKLVLTWDGGSSTDFPLEVPENGAELELRPR